MLTKTVLAFAAGVLLTAALVYFAGGGTRSGVLAGAAAPLAFIAAAPRQVARFILAAADGIRAFRLSFKTQTYRPQNAPPCELREPERIQGPGARGQGPVNPVAGLDAIQRDTLSALVGLGMNRRQALGRLAAVGTDSSVDALLRKALAYREAA